LLVGDVTRSFRLCDTKLLKGIKL